MADLLTFTPLFADQDEDAILARWRDWANEGRDPAEDVDQWTDTREGSMWWVHTTPGRREAARLYDLAGTEVVAAAFPQWAWGEYLDDHGELRAVGRLAATAATGEVTFTGDDGTLIPPGTTVGVEPQDPDAPAPEFTTTEAGTIDVSLEVTVPVRASQGGSDGNVAAGAITAILTPTDGVTAVINDDATVGGTDTETDAALRDRILESYVGAAIANQLYYRRLAMNFPGIGRATVIPVAAGAGTITIVVSTADGDPVSSDVVDAFQAFVDPLPGLGAGAGQVGATITVVTATTLLIVPVMTVEFETGYSMDGAGGTVPMRDSIIAVIGAYVDGVETGQEVVRQAVIGRVMALQGVHDVGGVTLNGVAANVAVPTAPPKVPTLGSTAGIVEGSV